MGGFKCRDDKKEFTEKGGETHRVAHARRTVVRLRNPEKGVSVRDSG